MNARDLPAPEQQHTERYFALAGRELDPRTVGLVAAAQTHLPTPKRATRAPAIAYTYSVAPERALWGCWRDRVLVAIVGVESRAASLWLHDISVRSDLRRLGIGQRLLEFVRDTYGDIAIEGNAALEAAPSSRPAASSSPSSVASVPAPRGRTSRFLQAAPSRTPSKHTQTRRRAPAVAGQATRRAVDTVRR